MDDIIRSAALTTSFFQTDEIMVINHADCGMMRAADEAVVDGLEKAPGGDLAEVSLDPSLPEFDIGDANVADWVRMTDDIDVACAKQAGYLEEYDPIPDDVQVNGYVYEVETGSLRRPGERPSEKVNTRVEE